MTLLTALNAILLYCSLAPSTHIAETCVREATHCVVWIKEDLISDKALSECLPVLEEP